MHKDKDIIKKDMISERSLNRILIPVMRKRGYKDITFPLTMTSPTHDISISSHWDSKNFMILDFISHVIVDYFYRVKINADDERYAYIPSNPYNGHTDSIMIEIENQHVGFNKNMLYDNRFTIHNPMNVIQESLFKRFYGCSGYTSAKINDLIESTSKCKFTMQYPIRVFNKQIGKYTYMNIDIEDDNIFDVEIAYEYIKSRADLKRYKLNFKSLLGRAFLYNLASINFDWIPSKSNNFYHLPDVAQLLYRKYILTRNGFNKVKYKDTTLISGLGFKSSQYANNMKCIIKNLEHLKDESLIDKWDITNKCFTFYKNIKENN